MKGLDGMTMLRLKLQMRAFKHAREISPYEIQRLKQGYKCPDSSSSASSPYVNLTQLALDSQSSVSARERPLENDGHNLCLGLSYPSPTVSISLVDDDTDDASNAENLVSEDGDSHDRQFPLTLTPMDLCTQPDGMEGEEEECSASAIIDLSFSQDSALAQIQGDHFLDMNSQNTVLDSPDSPYRRKTRSQSQN